MATTLDILNTIRDNASELYITRIPEATKSNLMQIGDAITSDKNIMNEFITSLVNKVVETNIRSKLFKNPLARLKGTEIPMGNTIEEIFVNPAVDTGFNTDGNMLLKQVTPDVKVCYYAMNRQSSYSVSISKIQLKRAFTNEQAFMELYNSIVTSLYSGDEIDEFITCKNVIGKTIDEGAITVIDSDLSNAKGLAKSIGTMAKSMQFPTTDLCGYNKVNADKIAEGETACLTFTPTDSQALFITATAQTEIDYEFLATIYNKSVAELQAISILVDEIPSENYEVYAVLCDIGCLQLRDNDFVVDNFINPSNQTVKAFLHHWQTIYFSMFGNAVAYGKEKSE